jgi:hypothetical protein
MKDVVRWSADPDAPAGMRELLRAANAADAGPSAAQITSMRGAVAAKVVAKAAFFTARTIIVGLLVVGTGAGIVGYVASRPDHPALRVEHAPIAQFEPPPPLPEPSPPPAIVIAPEPAAPPHLRVAAPKPAPVEVAPAPPPAPKISEVTLLEQARVALRGGDTTHALALAEQHATVYPDGTLVEEREALTIEALIKLGRRDEALAKWSKFASSYPQSNYRARLQRLIDIPK